MHATALFPYRLPPRVTTISGSPPRELSRDPTNAIPSKANLTQSRLWPAFATSKTTSTTTHYSKSSVASNTVRIDKGTAGYSIFLFNLFSLWPPKPRDLFPAAHPLASARHSARGFFFCPWRFGRCNAHTTRFTQLGCPDSDPLK